MHPQFTLTNTHSRGGHFYSWRLKEGEIRFRGRGEYEGLVLQRIPASAEGIAEFHSALDLVSVWTWRNDYKPGDVDMACLDGSYWTFTASFGSYSCDAAGENAYPSIADPKQTTIDNCGRFKLLEAAFYDVFNIESYILLAKHHAKLAADLGNGTTGAH